MVKKANSSKSKPRSNPLTPRSETHKTLEEFLEFFKNEKQNHQKALSAIERMKKIIGVTFLCGKD